MNTFCRVKMIRYDMKYGWVCSFQSLLITEKGKKKKKKYSMSTSNRSKTFVQSPKKNSEMDYFHRRRLLLDCSIFGKQRQRADTSPQSLLSHLVLRLHVLILEMVDDCLQWTYYFGTTDFSLFEHTVHVKYNLSSLPLLQTVRYCILMIHRLILVYNSVMFLSERL